MAAEQVGGVAPDLAAFGVTLGESHLVEELHQRQRQMPAQGQGFSQILDVEPLVRVGLRQLLRGLGQGVQVLRLDRTPALQAKISIEREVFMSLGGPYFVP